jgi:hypothetical protein
MKNLIAAALAFLAVGCTTYQDGASSHWPRPDVLIVSGSGNGYTSDEAVAEFVMLQAAERALQSNYYYFVLLDSADTSRTTTGYMNTPRTTTTNAFGTGNYYSATSTTTGGITAYPIYFPGMEAAFQMFEDVPPGFRPGQYFSAVDVYNDLGPKHLGDKFRPASHKAQGTSGHR